MGAVIEILDLAVVRKERKVVSYLHCNTTRSVYLLRRCAVVVVRGLRLIQPAPAVRLPQRPELSLTYRPRADFQRHHHRAVHPGLRLIELIAPATRPPRYPELPFTTRGRRHTFSLCRLRHLPFIIEREPRIF